MSIQLAEAASVAVPTSGRGRIYISTAHLLTLSDSLGGVHTLADIDSVQTLSNKKLSDATTSIIDDGDATKVAVFSLAGGTTGKTSTLVLSPTDNRSITFPDASDTLVGKATSDALTNKSVIWTPGTTAIAPEVFQGGGSLLTSAAAGAVEFDNTAFYKTIDTTSGRAQDCVQNIFRLTGDGSALGPTIADYFGANSSFPTVTNGVYWMVFYLWFLKTTAGVVTWTITNTQTYTDIAAWYFQDAVGGIGSDAAVNGAGIHNTTTAAAALPVNASNLTTATDQFAVVYAKVECGTAGNIRLRVTSSAGTVTPRRGSYYTAQRLFAGNVGTFVA